MKKWFAVIGDPIEHSKSPAMHNAWFEEMSVEATYIPLHVSSEQLGAAVAGLKTLGASGWNVTIPHKTAIIPYLDELDELAQKMGAVNTVVRTTNGKLKGFNIVDEMGIGRAISLKEAEETLAHFSIIVQMTSAGLATGNFSMPFSLNRLAKGAIVADIVYNPLMTPFLQAAEEKGATIVTGLGMFVHQGAIAFEHWLGDYPNTNSMIVQLNAQLGGN